MLDSILKQMEINPAVLMINLIYSILLIYV